MENQTETVFISDDTVCSMLIKNRTSGGKCGKFVCMCLCV